MSLDLFTKNGLICIIPETYEEESAPTLKVLRNISRKLNFDTHFIFNIFRRKDLNKKPNKTIFFFQKNFPKLFYKIKNLAIEFKIKITLDNIWGFIY